MTETTSHAYDVTIDDFEEKVIRASHRVPVVVDFWAEWCAPCRALKPLLEKLAAEYQGRFLLARVNSDDNQPLAAEFGIRSIPAVKVLIDGAVVDEFVGAMPESRLRDFIDRCLPSLAEPMRIEAIGMLDRGDINGATSLLEKAFATDHRNEKVRLDLAGLRIKTGQPERVAELLEDDIPWQDRARIDALRAELALAQQAEPEVGLEELRDQVLHSPDQLDARLDLANSLARRHEYREALTQLLEIVQRNRRWNDEAGRKAMLNLFNLLGADPEQEMLVREFRVALARTLN